jgi:hypothetical protein
VSGWSTLHLLSDNYNASNYIYSEGLEILMRGELQRMTKKMVIA